ncbi:hypothetical protein RSO01_47550 [Reyranella soli]|uniref:Uncharacterized protein n=1 Tax=Reyranella soli TaxID=1230389 RepID=A0A512NF72_9HYPH|nr:hypothetical protein [Reyranella soli]GEP57589.1 hypothetical protein RSO01_47550 [Reyranella soli]
MVVLDRARFLLGVPNVTKRGCDGATASQRNMDWATLCYGKQLAPLIFSEITVEGENAFKAYLIGAILSEVLNSHSDSRKSPGPLISEKPDSHRCAGTQGTTKQIVRIWTATPTSNRWRLV